MTETERRKFLKLVGVSLAGVAGVSILGCKPEKTQDIDDALSSEEDEIPTLPPQNVSWKPLTPTREALAERLKVLAEDEWPTAFTSAAMCYVIEASDDVTELCPDCGKINTLGLKDAILRAYNVPLKRIQDLGLNAILTIPEHCPTCGFGLIEKKFLLEIRYPDDPDFVRVELDEIDDLQMMTHFLQGKDYWEDGEGGTYRLKDKVDRLRKLFGVEEP